MKSISRTLFVACVLSGVSVVAARADGLWQAGDTLFRLQASGQERSLVVETPSAAAEAQGLRAGTVVFRGRRDGAAYVGAVYGGDCGTDGVPARGRIVNETSVILEPDGVACGGLSDGPLELRFIGKASGAAAVAPEALADAPEVPADQERAQSEAGPVAEATVAKPQIDAEAQADVAKADAEPLAGAAATAPQVPVPLVVPAKACLSKVVAQKVNLAACRGLLAGARLNTGADLQAETKRNERITAGSGAGTLYPAVDARCYADATLNSYQDGVELAQSKPVVADSLSPMCLEAMAAAYAVPAAGLVAVVAQAAGSIGSQVWTKAGAGKACKGQSVLRLTAAGLFQGRFGAEKAIYNGAWLDWSDDGTTAQGRMEVHSEILTAPDMVIEVSAERVDAALAVTMVVERVTPQSRYSASPEYSAETIAETYFPCTQ